MYFKSTLPEVACFLLSIYMSLLLLLIFNYLESTNISTIPSTALFFRDFERVNKRIGRDFVRKVSALCKQPPLIRRRIMFDWMVFFKG